MVNFKNMIEHLTNRDKDHEVNKKLRGSLRPPVVAFDRKGHPVDYYYLDLQGERDYSKNKRIKRVASSPKN